LEPQVPKFGFSQKSNLTTLELFFGRRTIKSDFIARAEILGSKVSSKTRQKASSEKHTAKAQDFAPKEEVEKPSEKYVDFQFKRIRTF